MNTRKLLNIGSALREVFSRHVGMAHLAAMEVALNSN